MKQIKEFPYNFKAKKSTHYLFSKGIMEYEKGTLKKSGSALNMTLVALLGRQEDNRKIQ